MKKLLPLILGLFLAHSLSAQLLKQEDVQRIKNARLYIIKTDNSEINDLLKTALEQHWTFSETAEFIDWNTGQEKARNEENSVLIGFQINSARSLKHRLNDMYDYVNVSKNINLSIYGGDKKPLLRQPIPTLGNDYELTQEFVSFGVAALNHQLQVMDQQKLKNNMKLQKAMHAESHVLKERKLLIPETLLAKKLTATEAKDIYGENLEFVSIEKWRNAILNKEANVAYNIVVPYAIGGGYIYMHYLMDAQSGQILAIVEPKAPASLGAPGKNISLSKNNTPEVNKSIMKKIAEAPDGKW